MSGMRPIMARWKSCFIRVPIAFESPGFAAAGKFSANTLPVAMMSANEGIGVPCFRSAFASRSKHSFGGQKICFTVGLSSNSERNTEIPSTIEVRSFGSILDQSFSNHLRTASNC